MNADLLSLLYLVRPPIGSELMKGEKEYTDNIFRNTSGGYLPQDSYVAAVIWHEIEHTNHLESLVPPTRPYRNNWVTGEGKGLFGSSE